MVFLWDWQNTMTSYPKYIPKRPFLRRINKLFCKNSRAYEPYRRKHFFFLEFYFNETITFWQKRKELGNDIIADNNI